MNIGEASKVTAVSAKMIRHYESIGLIPASHRTDAGYRIYTEKDLSALHFIRRSRDLGFSLDEIRELLSLWQDQHRASGDVKAIAQRHVADLDQRIAALTEMRDTLVELAGACRGDQRPDCPILIGIAATPNAAVRN